MNTCQSGALGEEAACNYLKKQGMTILARNYRKPCGEIDIVALAGRTLVFAEVKKRATGAFGGPLAAVTAAKQHKITLSAECYIKENTPKFDSIRFDVVCLLAGKITHIPNAFSPRRGTL